MVGDQDAGLLLLNGVLSKVVEAATVLALRLEPSQCPVVVASVLEVEVEVAMKVLVPTCPLEIAVVVGEASEEEARPAATCPLENTVVVGRK